MKKKVFYGSRKDRFSIIFDTGTVTECEREIHEGTNGKMKQRKKRHEND